MKAQEGRFELPGNEANEGFSRQRTQKTQRSKAAVNAPHCKRFANPVFSLESAKSA